MIEALLRVPNIYADAFWVNFTALEWWVLRQLAEPLGSIFIAEIFSATPTACFVDFAV